MSMKYVSREQWGAIDSGRPLRPFRSALTGLVVHHTTGPSDNPRRRVRGHDRYHVLTKGWDSIAYNWLVSGETGEIFEGRGWMRGAATRGHNFNTIAVALVGDSDDGLTHTGKEAILAVVGAAREKYGSHLWVKCHQDFSTTDCPGDSLKGWVSAGMRVDDTPSTNTVVDWAGILRYVLEMGDTVTPIKRGSSGAWVALAQRKLNDRGADLMVDGIYGRKSARACRRFQSQFAMKVNGIVDSHTWKVLWTI